MIVASIIAAPRQRNTDAEKADLKAGRIPDDWAANPAKLRQKDRDGRWTLKRGRRKRKPDGTLMMDIATPVYGYKSHVGVDRRHRFIRTWSVTDAARYDDRELAGLLDQSNTGSSVWADTAYRSAKNENRIAKAGLVSKVHFGKPMEGTPPGGDVADALGGLEGVEDVHHIHAWALTSGAGRPGGHANPRPRPAAGSLWLLLRDASAGNDLPRRGRRRVNRRDPAPFRRRGTPGLMVGRTVVNGAIDEATLGALIERERADGPPPGCIAG